MNLATAFLQSAQKCAGKPAIFWGEEVVTYDDIVAQSRWLASKLSDEMLVKPGERVAIWLKNCPEFVSVLFGILQSGAVVVPINNFLKPDEVAYILKDCGAKILISDAGMQEGTARLRDSIPGLQVLETESLGRSAEPLSRENTQNEKDLAVIIYTSGTTGRPKGAMLSHGNLLHNVESCRQVLQAVSFDRIYAPRSRPPAGG